MLDGMKQAAHVDGPSLCHICIKHRGMLQCGTCDAGHAYRQLLQRAFCPPFLGFEAELIMPRVLPFPLCTQGARLNSAPSLPLHRTSRDTCVAACRGLPGQQLFCSPVRLSSCACASCLQRGCKTSSCQSTLELILEATPSAALRDWAGRPPLHHLLLVSTRFVSQPLSRTEESPTGEPGMMAAVPSAQPKSCQPVFEVSRSNKHCHACLHVPFC